MRSTTPPPGTAPPANSPTASRAAAAAVRAAFSALLGHRTPRARARPYVLHYEDVLGTSLELQVVAAGVGPARRAEQAALAEVDRLAAVLSGYSSTSELSRWQATRGEAVAVSTPLAEVLDACEVWRVRTGGAFNAGAASLVELLRDAEGAGRGRAVDERAMGERLRALDGPLWAVDRARGVATRLV